MLQDILPFSLAHLVISVSAAVGPEVGHMTPKKWAWLLRMLRYSTYSDPKHSSATIVELFRFSIFMPEPVLNSTEVALHHLRTQYLKQKLETKDNFDKSRESG